MRLILIGLLLSISSPCFSSVDAFEVSYRVHSYQCEQIIDNYKFESEFKKLFSYLDYNEFSSLLSQVIEEVDNETLSSCRDKGYFDFQIQSCYDSCLNHLEIGKFDLKVSVKKKLKPLCYATCNSIKFRSTDLHTDVYEIEKRKLK